MKGVIDEDQHFYNLIREVMVAALHNHAPNVCVEVGRQNTPANLRPSYNELEGRAARVQAEPRRMILRAARGRWRSLGAAAPVLAAEGGPIRGGEHAGFSRIVMTIEPTTEWSLESGDGHGRRSAFPGRTLAFDTAEVFARMPHDAHPRRQRGRARPAAPRCASTLGCDCRVSTAFVGAQYLALDVADRGAPPRAGRAPETAEERARRARPRSSPRPRRCSSARSSAPPARGSSR